MPGGRDHTPGLAGPPSTALDFSSLQTCGRCDQEDGRAGTYLLPALQAWLGVLQAPFPLTQWVPTLISQSPGLGGWEEPTHQAPSPLPQPSVRLPASGRGPLPTEFWGPSVLVSLPVPPAAAGRHYHFSMMWLM